MKAFQDYYSDHIAQCYGCGKLNESGLQIKSYWKGDETVCQFHPKSYHTAIPGYVYGGLIASLMDCHATGTAAAAMYRKENREMGSEPEFRFVTASLKVNYLKPTPIDKTIQLIGRIKEITSRKVIVEIELFSEDALCATGEIITVQAPEHLLK